MKLPLFFMTLFVAVVNCFGQTQDVSMTELLERYHAIPSNGHSISHYFTASEVTRLQEHFRTSSNTAVTTNRDTNGALIYGNSFNDDAFISFDADTPGSLNILGNNAETGDFEAAGDIDPQDLNTAYVLTLIQGEFLRLDIPSATYTFLGNVLPPNGQNWNGIEFDPTTNTLYGVSSNFDTTSTLSIIDIDNLSSTPVGDTGAPGLISIAIDDNGNAYGHDVVSDNFYTIDLETATANALAPLGFDANFGQDLEWDAVSQTLYMTAYNNANGLGEFRIVNTETGENTYVSNLGPGGSQVSWASIQNPTLSVTENTFTTLSVFPNPAKDQITINTLRSDLTVKVINVVGQTVIETTTETQQTISISELPNGIYFLQATNPSGNQKTVRFIKA